MRRMAFIVEEQRDCGRRRGRAMGKKNDLRWVRSERNIMRTFDEMLHEMPLSKITVTALAKNADMNKATFYLHYCDIYALAEAYAAKLACDTVEHMGFITEFYSDPASFAAHYVAALRADSKMHGLLEENGLAHFYEEHLESCLHRAIADAAPEDAGNVGDEDSRIAASFIFGGLASAVRRAGESDRLEEVLGTLMEAISEHGKKLIDDEAKGATS